MNGAAALYAVAFIALYVGHQVGDYWLQTPAQAGGKAAPGWAGRLACGRHVATLTLTQLGAVLALAVVLGVHLAPVQLGVGLAVNAASHWWADRRHTLAGLVAAMDRGPWPGKAGFLALGMPRDGHDDAPTLGTGAHALDQAWHVAWLAAAAAVIAA
jgi:hypothetical protein